MIKEKFIKAIELNDEIEDLKQAIEKLQSTNNEVAFYEKDKIQYCSIKCTTFMILDKETRKLLINHYESKIAELEKQFQEL